MGWGFPAGDGQLHPFLLYGREVIMTYTKQGDRITLEMTQEEFDDVLEYGKGRDQQMR